MSPLVRDCKRRLSHGEVTEGVMDSGMLTTMRRHVTPVVNVGGDEWIPGWSLRKSATRDCLTVVSQPVFVFGRFRHYV
jgi:hypothetical protein